MRRQSASRHRSRTISSAYTHRHEACGGQRVADALPVDDAVREVDHVHLRHPREAFGVAPDVLAVRLDRYVQVAVVPPGHRDPGGPAAGVHVDVDDRCHGTGTVADNVKGCSAPGVDPVHGPADPVPLREGVLVHVGPDGVAPYEPVHPVPDALAPPDGETERRAVGGEDI